MTALGIVLLSADDGGRGGRTASITASSIAAPAAATVAPATSSATPAPTTAPTAPPTAPATTTTAAPVTSPPPEYYVGFWNDNDIAVDDVELVDADASRAIADVVLRWNGSSDAITDRFELRRGPDGQLLIARQDTIAR